MKLLMNYSKQLPIENEHREYKQNTKGLTKDLWETISAFENTDGGTIILGVTEIEKNSKFGITGVTDPQNTLDIFWSSIDDIISYKTIQNDDVKIVKINEATVIEIHVDSAPDNKKPVYSHGKIFVRQGATDCKANREQQATLIRQSSDDLDTKVLKNYTIEDLNMADVQKYKTLLENKEHYKRYKETDIQQFLIKIGVISKNYEGDGKLGITVGGLLFFGENIAILHAFPNFQLDYFDKTNPNEQRWSKRISSIEENLNIFSFFEKVTQTITKTISNPFKLDKDLRRVDTGGDMKVALREALINMLMHADYYGNTPIKVEENINFYNFINPGKMKIPSQDFFTTNNTKTRNPIISKLFVQMGDGERAGQGGEKIYEAAVTSDLRVPEINTDINKTDLRIWKVAYLNSFEGENIDKNAQLILKSILMAGGSPRSHKEIEKDTKLSRALVTNSLNTLLSKEILVKYGNARSTRYGIPSSSEQLMAQLQIIPSLIRKAYLASKNAPQ